MTPRCSRSVPLDASGEIRPDLKLYVNAVPCWTNYFSGTFYELPPVCTSFAPFTDDCMVYFQGDTELPMDLPLMIEETWPELQSGCAD